MISITIKKEDVPEILLSDKDRFRAECLDMWDTIGGRSEWVQSFVAYTAHQFYGKGGSLGLGWKHVYYYVVKVFNFGKDTRELLEYVEEVTLSDDDVELYKQYCKYVNYVNYLKEGYWAGDNSCTYRDAVDGRNVRGELCGYIIGVDTDIMESLSYADWVNL